MSDQTDLEYEMRERVLGIMVNKGVLYHPNDTEVIDGVIVLNKSSPEYGWVGKIVATKESGEMSQYNALADMKKVGFPGGPMLTEYGAKKGGLLGRGESFVEFPANPGYVGVLPRK